MVTQPANPAEGRGMGLEALLVFKSAVQGVGDFWERSQSRLTPNCFDGKLIPVISMDCDGSLTPAGMVIAKGNSYLTLRLPELVAHIPPQRQRLDALLAVVGRVVHPLSQSPANPNGSRLLRTIYTGCFLRLTCCHS